MPWRNCLGALLGKEGMGQGSGGRRELYQCACGRKTKIKKQSQKKKS